MAVLGRAATGVALVNGEGTLLIGDASGVIAELPIGGAGQVLTSNGTTASWQPAGGGGVTWEDEGGVVGAGTFTTVNFTGAGVTATDAGAGQLDVTIPGGGGFTDPMTTNGDLITQAGGVPARIGVGTNGQVLTVVAGAPAWAAAASGFADPMTSIGDIIIRDGTNTTARLAAGANGNVLTLAGGVPTWAAPSGGGAPTGASYITLGTDATLTSERVLTAGAGVDFTDGGAGGNLTVAADINGLPDLGAGVVAADEIMVWDVSVGSLQKTAITNLPGGGGTTITTFEIVYTTDGFTGAPDTVTTTPPGWTITPSGNNLLISVHTAASELPDDVSVYANIGGNNHHVNPSVNWKIQANSPTDMTVETATTGEIGAPAGSAITIRLRYYS